MKHKIMTISVLSIMFISGCSSADWSKSGETVDQQIKKILNGNIEQSSDEQELISPEKKEEPPTKEQVVPDEPNKEEEPTIPDMYRNIIKEVNGKKIIVNPENMLSVVNKVQNLPSSYTPEDLVIPNVLFPFSGDLPKKYLRKEAALALEEMFQAALHDGIEMMAISGYRSYDRQAEIFFNKAKNVGDEEANQLVAYPGQSEHQTGLAIDVSSPDFGFKLEEEFGETTAGIWLQQNAYQFGFIIRYPKGKENLTGYEYEPWHLRYVGKEAALQIQQNQITLEEYMGIVEKS